MGGCAAEISRNYYKSQETAPNASQRVSKPQWKKLFYKSQETAPNASQRVSKPQWKKLAKSRLQFLSASFYVPGTPCTRACKLLLPVPLPL